jgi:hypothetical protein
MQRRPSAISCALVSLGTYGIGGHCLREPPYLRLSVDLRTDAGLR